MRKRQNAKARRNPPVSREHARKVTQIDRRVGANVRKLRLARGLSMQELSVSVGVSHQQLQKYETGANRISAGKLNTIAMRLSVPVESLFHENIQASVWLDGARAKDAPELRRECAFWLSQIHSLKTLKLAANTLRALF